ncbi:NB-ARC domain-containing protein [Actinokineospora diospyrosa]|uniref:NB-ARC domain-containing protein n=1 Tax=Actinokineospora diospyrosa TaxID=103728 RepID=UPI0020A35D23|nr:NB-ARC domain-containing protein [Actinokineospora diospyrosa]
MTHRPRTRRPRTHNEVSGTVHGPVIQADHVTITGGAVAADVWLVPEPDRDLIDRAELADLIAAVQAGTSVIGVIGSGGFGKTTLVGQACRALRADFPGGVLWITLGEHVPDPVLADKVNDLTEALTGTRPSFADPVVAGHHLAHLLSTRPRTLLVVDDVWATSRLAPLLGAPQVIATSRTRGTVPLTATVVPVGSLSAAESHSLLTLGLPGLTRTAPLTRLTGRWALLLSLVNSAVRLATEDGTDPDLAAEEVAEQLRAEGPDSLDLDTRDGRNQAVRATVEASTRRLSPEDRARFAELGAFPEDTAIPIDVVRALWPTSRRLVRQLTDLALITRTGDSLRLHDVLRTYLRHVLGPALTQVSSRLVEILRASPWATAGPYALRHLSTHAAEAGLLDDLICDPEYLLAADQPELLAALPATHTDSGRTAAQIYRRVAHHLRDRPHAERPAYLELASLRMRADLPFPQAEQAPWRCERAEWVPEHAHTVVARHPVAIVGAAVVPRADGRTWVLSLDKSGALWVIDLERNERVEPTWTARAQGATAVTSFPHGVGHAVLFGFPSGEFRGWDVESGEPLRWAFPDPDKGVVTAIASTPAGPVVVAALGNTWLWSWDVAAGRPAGPMIRAAGARGDLAVSSRAGHPIATISRHWPAVGTSWKLTTGEAVEQAAPPLPTLGRDVSTAMFNAHSGTCARIDSPRPGWAVTWGRFDHTVRLWDTTGSTPAAETLWSVQAVELLVRAGEFVVSAQPSAHHVWRADGTGPWLTGEPLWSAAAADPALLVYVTPDTTKVVNLHDNTVRHLRGSRAGELVLACLSEGNRVLGVFAYGHTCALRDLTAGTEVWATNTASHGGHAVFHPARGVVLTDSGPDYSLEARTISTGEEVVLEGPAGPVLAMCVADHAFALIEAENPEVWDVDAMVCLAVLPPFELNPVVALHHWGDALIVLAGGHRLTVHIVPLTGGAGPVVPPIDLDTNITALAVDHLGRIVVGTDLGLVWLRLRSPQGWRKMGT